MFCIIFLKNVFYVLVIDAFILIFDFCHLTKIMCEYLCVSVFFCVCLYVCVGQCTPFEQSLNTTMKDLSLIIMLACREACFDTNV